MGAVAQKEESHERVEAAHRRDAEAQTQDPFGMHGAQQEPRPLETRGLAEPSNTRADGDGRVVVASLLAAALVDSAITLTLGYVGWRVARRHHTPEDARAAFGFAAWWYGLAFTVFTNAWREAAAGLAVEGRLAAVVPVAHAAYIVALVASVCGLLYYLTYIFTGRAAWFWPLVAFYAAYGAAAVWISARLSPDGLVAGPWFVQWHYARPELGGGLLLVMVLLLLLPQLAAAIAYGTLYRRTPEGIARRRIALVSTALIVWLGSALVAPALQLGRFEWWQAGGRFVGLASAIVILYAYVSTRAPIPTAPHVVARFDPALAARVRDLV